LYCLSRYLPAGRGRWLGVGQVLVVDREGEPPRCAECQCSSRPGENASDTGRAHSDGLGELRVLMESRQCWRSRRDAEISR
jgi:hypothetical protein